MDFEYDRRKGKTLQAGHDIDFDAAHALWQGPALIKMPARARPVAPDVQSRKAQCSVR